VASHVYEVSNI
jgi:hypothetical protein